MVDLRCIIEAIKLQFSKPESMKFEDIQFFDKSGSGNISMSIGYEIIGAYLDNHRIKVVINIRKFDCFEIPFGLLLKELQRKLRQEILKRIPEADGDIDISFIIATIMKELE